MNSITDILGATNMLDKAISLDTFNEISFSESSEHALTTPSECSSSATEVFMDESLPFQIYNYVYNKKSEFAVMHTPFWQSFKAEHPNVSLTPIELKMLFFEKILPYTQHFSNLTSYQKTYFANMHDFFKEFDIEKLRTNDPIAGIHYYRADDIDTFLSLLKQPEVNIIGTTENVNCDIYNEANSNRLFQMNEGIRVCYSAFLRNANEMQGNILLEQSEIVKRLRIYFAEGKMLPSISEIIQILQSTPLRARAPATSSMLMSYSRSSSYSQSDSLSSSDSRAELTRYFDGISGDPIYKVRKPKRDTKTLRKMQDNLRNPKLKEMERKAKAARRRFQKYL